MRTVIAVLLSFVIISSMLSPIQADVSPMKAEGSVRIYPVADAYIDPARPALNFGASQDLLAEYFSGLTPYVKFNIPQIPNNAGFLSARLNLFLRGKSSDITSSIALFKANTSKWDELRITYLNAPRISDKLVAVNRTVAFAQTWQSWNVTSEIGALIKANGGEISFALKSVNNTGTHTFSSKDSNQKPYIEIRYSLSDNRPPIVSKVWFEPEKPSVEDIIRVFANVTDDISGISKVSLHYIKNLDSEWAISEMKVSTGSVYLGTIPRQPSNSIVSFYVDATDFAGNSNSTKVLALNVTRPSYYLKLVDGVNQTRTHYERLIVNNTRAFEAMLANKSRIFDLTLNRTVSFYEGKLLVLNQSRLLLVNGYKELLDDYEALLVNYTRLGREANGVGIKLTSISAIFLELKNQSRYVEEAYQGQKGEIDGLKSSLDASRQGYKELKSDYDRIVAQLSKQNNEVGRYSLASLATGAGLIAVTSVSVLRYRKNIERIFTRAFNGKADRAKKE